ncbi:hypothetical protein LP415_08400 [Polaromonas sp. P1(28)-8]|nr:hypothetical protein LP415_08400 [Polaromonas sp. P1(28)-8]
MIGLEGVSAQELSDLIGAIYDCALDPQRWPATCRKVADLCESTAGGICVHDLRHVQNDQLFVFGYQPEFLGKLGSQYAESPMAAADVVSDIGDVSALSMERYQLLESRFFREVLKPFGLLDMIWFPALQDRRAHGFHACLPERDGPCIFSSVMSVCSSFFLRMYAEHSPSPMCSISGRSGRRCSKKRWMDLLPVFSSRRAMVTSFT